jgi:hypothetical protein
MDQTLGNDGKTPTLYAEPKVSRPRICLLDAVSGEPSTLPIKHQDGWDVYPTGELEWR